MTKVGALGAALAIALTTGVAAADTPPSVWERAAAPALAEEHALHEAVQRRLHGASSWRTGDETINERLKALLRAEFGRALAMLQAAGAEKSANPLLRFDLADVYYVLDDHPRAARLYRAALADFPAHPRADAAWHSLAMACGHIGDHDCERVAYHEVLRRETEDLLRAIPSLNLAETEMHQGDLREAIDRFRETFRLAATLPQSTTPPLALWGLAVALDRAGEHAAAEREGKLALQLERSLGYRNPAHNPLPLVISRDVFYVPEYEKFWYLGLGEVAAAQAGSGAREALQHWKNADRFFAQWLAGAEKRREKDRWLPMAKARAARVRAELAKASAAADKELPQVHDAPSKTFRL